MRTLARFLRDDSGVAAVEFGLIAPILAILALFIFDAWNAANSMTRMHTAVGAAARYLMGGQGDDATARAVALSSWNRRPADGAVSVVRQCICGTAVSACTGLCPNTQTPPAIYVTLRATGTGEGMFLHQSLAQSEVVRVR